MVMVCMLDENDEDGKIIVFFVIFDMFGFEVFEEWMEKIGICGMVIGCFKFIDMFVFKENIFGLVGKGFCVVFMVFDFGCIIFGVSCIGVVKLCLECMVYCVNMWW